MKVDKQLHQFLKKNETGMYRRKEQVIAYVHVFFHDLDEFVEVVGEDRFYEGGINDCTLFRDSVCIELNNIIEGQGHNLLAYQDCFEQSDIQTYGP